MKVGILQSNYIPWKGYFDLINSVDTFYFYDDVQFTKNDWRNRNKIKSANGLNWISIPCGSNLNRLINEVELTDHKWQDKHWNTLSQHYKNAAYFKDYKDFFEDFYLGKTWNNLSVLNQYLIKHISRYFLDIKTEFDDSVKYQLTGKKGARVIELLKKAKATVYLTGLNAKNYIVERDFTAEGISLEWMDYSGYPEYHQLNPPFEHNVSIVDLLFNEGKAVTNYMLSTKNKINDIKIIDRYR